MARYLLTGKKTLITGAASGIGRATALAAAKSGAELVLTDITAEGLAATAAEVIAAGGVVRHTGVADISDYDAVTSFAKEVHERVGSMDVVMNVAGVSAWGTVENLEHGHWRRMVDINLMGPIHIIENFVPPMIAAGRGGSLVNVSSAAGLFGFPWHAAYSASKFGLRGVSEVLRFDLRRHGIRVHLVVPGGVRTPLVQTLEIAGVDRDDPRAQKFESMFSRHAISPEKAAAAIVRGVERRKYMVYTSADIRIGHWWQRKFALPYEILMQLANNQLSKLLPKPKR